MVPSVAKTFVLCLAVLLWGYTSASYNLYLKATELRRLLGLHAELYYVRDGTVNSYALGFAIMIPNHVSELHFTWQSLTKTPVSYSIGISVAETGIINTPQLNISRRGILPTREEVFKVVLQCAGEMSAEVEVFMNINITVAQPSSKFTNLVLKRKKICLKGDETNGTLMLDAVLSTSLPFYAGVGCASTILVLLTAIVITTYMKTNKHRNREITYERNSPALSTSTHEHAFLRADTPNNASTTGSCSSSSQYKRIAPVPAVIEVHINEEVKQRSIPEQLDDMSLEKQKVILHEKLQEGTFGQIYHATVINDDPGAAAATHAIVKTVSDHASQIQVSLMMAEGMMMLGLNHKSILPLVGLCTEDPHHPLLIYPHMNQGNLKKFLLKCRMNEAHCHTLLTQDLVAMAIQIVQGIMFLHKQKIVHRDISTRNCVIDDWFQVRITDNALSRDLFPNDYYCLGDNENRPVKWLALESLMRKDFSCASDVWTFGVTLWELMTLASQPYSEIDPFEMEAYLRDGYRLAQPVNCPDELFSVMAHCWARNPDDRPTDVQLLSCLQNFYTALGRFI